MEWIKKKLSDLWIEILGGLIMLGLTSWATIWAILSSWAGPLIILLIVAFIALGLFIVSQLHVIKSRQGKGLARKSHNRIRNTVREGLDKEHLRIQNNPSDDLHFRFNTEDAMGRQVVVLRPKGEQEDFIIIGGSWKLPEKFHEKFDNMPQDIRDAMLEELKIELLGLKVSYKGLKIPIREIGAQSKVACDETTSQLQFLQMFNTVRYANILITIILEKGLRLAGYGADSLPDDLPKQT